jgi:ABC-type Mn2+/Zn2+ transport system ATPase subunit
MKIDLHCHTKKLKTGDGTARNISPKDFAQKMLNNDVKVCAITNHNRFLVDEYDRILATESDFLILPGIELDVKMPTEEHKRCQFILVCNPDKKKEFVEVFDEEERDPETYCMQYANLLTNIKKFESKDILIIPHFGGKEPCISEDQLHQLKKDIAGYVIIVEPSNIRTMGILNAHDELSLVGSDVRDWSNYPEKPLPELKFKIDSFLRLYELAKDPKKIIKDLLDNSEKQQIEITEGTKKATAPIFNDINIIFGGKGSGKTELLTKFIIPSLEKSGVKFIFHDGVDSVKNYKDMIDHYEDAFEIDPESSTKVAELFEKVVKHKEEPEKSIVQKYYKANSDKVKIESQKRFKKLDATFSPTETGKIEDIIKSAASDLRTINKVFEINDRVERNKSEKKILLDALNVLKSDVNSNSINKCRKLFSEKNAKLFIDGLKDTFKKKTGKNSKSTEIGFAKVVSARLNLLTTNGELNKALKGMTVSEKYDLGELPSHGMITLNVGVIVMKSDEKYYAGSPFPKKDITKWRDVIKKIRNMTIGEFGKSNNYFTNDESSIFGSDFVANVVKKSSCMTKSDGTEYMPSSGEQSILSISSVLKSNDYDYYIFDEIERGLGNKYIAEQLIPEIKALRDRNKTVILSTHNANIAITTLPSGTIYCNYPNEDIYYEGNLYSDELTGVFDKKSKLRWNETALNHLEGSNELFGIRRNIYGK